MDVVGSDYDTFDSRNMCMEAPSIYIIMARLARINGLKWAKMYEKILQCTDTESPKWDVLSTLQTKQIKFEPKDCIFFLKFLGIQFTPQLF